jgi:hypothetical protein
MSKKCLSVLLLVFFTVCVLGCKKKTGAISIEGEVSKGYYSSFGSSMTVSPVEYAVDLKITNIGSRPISYTSARSIFVPYKGTPLILETYVYNKSDSRNSYGKGNDKLMTLSPGASEEFHPATDGYTFNLLRDAGDRPLQFCFILVLNDTVIAGPMRANLPQLSDLVSTYFAGPKHKLMFFE